MAELGWGGAGVGVLGCWGRGSWSGTELRCSGVL